MIVHGFAISMTGLQQSDLERQLSRWTDRGSPVEQAVGIEGVVDAPASIRMEFEAHLGTALTDLLAYERLLLWARSVFFSQVLAQILTSGAHVWIEFEGMEVQICRDLRCQPAQGLLQSAQTYGTPGARDIRNEVDGQVCHRADGSALSACLTGRS